MMEKKYKQNEKVPDFSLGISKTIFYPTHPVRKKMKKMTWGVLNRGKWAKSGFSENGLK